jgi:glycosyltransferase involved in cell wall biosynthesis
MITIAVTTYDRPNYLKLSLDAIVNQTYTDFELVILDNGSGIETELIIQEYLENDQRIRVIKNAVNSRGFINEIFHLLSRKYLIWTHDDDVMHNNFLAEMIRCIESNKLDFMGCAVQFVDNQGVIIGNTEVELYSNDLFILSGDPVRCFFNGQYPFLPTVIMSTEFLRATRIKFDLSAGPAADAYFWSEVMNLGGKIGVLKKKLFQYRLHSSQDSNLNRFIMEIQLFNKWLTNHKYKTEYWGMIFNRSIDDYLTVMNSSDSVISVYIRDFVNKSHESWWILNDSRINGGRFIFDKYYIAYQRLSSCGDKDLIDDLKKLMNQMKHSKIGFKRKIYVIIDINRFVLLFPLLRLWRKMKNIVVSFNK